MTKSNQLLLDKIPSMYIEEVNKYLNYWKDSVEKREKVTGVMTVVPSNDDVTLLKALHDRRAILFIADQLLNAWEFFDGVDETVEYMNTENDFNEVELKRCINDWLENKDNMRIDCEMMKRDVSEFLSQYKLLHTPESKS